MSQYQPKAQDEYALPDDYGEIVWVAAKIIGLKDWKVINHISILLMHVVRSEMHLW